jgi:hypothetical protein
MKLTFIRTGERTYTTIATRDDGVTLRIPGVGNPTWIPHDLAHFIVEQALVLTRGFWGCVAGGAVFRGMIIVSGRLPPHAAARSRAIIKEMGQDGTEAEVLVGILVGIAQEGIDPRGPVARTRIADAWRNPRQTEQKPLGVEQVLAICTTLRDMQQQWQQLTIGQSITVSWFTDRSRKRSIDACG